MKYLTLPKALRISAVLLLCTAVVHADPILAWKLEQKPAPQQLAASVVDVALETGHGLNTLERTGVKEQTGLNRVYSSTGWNTTDTLDKDTKYIGFKMTVKPGQTIVLASLDYRISGGKPAPGKGRWGYSTDGGKTWTLQEPFLIPENSSRTGFDMGSWRFQNFTVHAGQTVIFRFWAYGKENIGGNGAPRPGSNVRLWGGYGNDLILQGKVQ
ncbi:MAG: hypothetical protein Q7Q73_06785 [Verrucomicrobiota bacterium JB024]|jgi:hypothetical protein|nr:hypothetical protein [Verrucomicrobiota bacterium JB024]